MLVVYKKGNIERARMLGRVMTRAERRLWYDGLRGCGAGADNP